NVAEALRRARTVADQTDLPLMVHVGPPGLPLPDLLAIMRAGDIVTHSFTALARPRLASEGRGLAAAWAARGGGVLFDVGHGMSGFDATVAGNAIRAGFPPDTISTDM